MFGKNRKITLKEVYNIYNIMRADTDARKGKSKHYGVRVFDRNRYENYEKIRQSLIDRTYKTPCPKIEKKFCEHKVRTLAKIPYYDHVVHHALMRVIMPVLHKSYFYESAASIHGRGIHYTAGHVRKFIDKNSHKELWWTQMDFTKFYHHIDRQKIYDRLCRTFGDEGIRWLLHDIIWCMGSSNGLTDGDGNTGLGIGLYPIQPLVNFYTGDMCRAISRLPDIRLFVYCDNLLIIGFSPKAVWDAVGFVKRYADEELRQPMHSNIGVQKLDDIHPIDYVGYLFYRNKTHVRKSIKYNFKRKFRNTTDEDKRRQILASYKGWLMHSDGLALWKTVTNMKTFKELNLGNSETVRDGVRYFECPLISARYLVDRELIVKDFIEDAKTRNGLRMCILVEENGRDAKFMTDNSRLKDIMIQARNQNELPFTATFRSRTISGGITDYYFE